MERQQARIDDYWLWTGRKKQRRRKFFALRSSLRPTFGWPMAHSMLTAANKIINWATINARHAQGWLPFSLFSMLFCILHANKRRRGRRGGAAGHKVPTNRQIWVLEPIR
jgi:hypothetical protein